jgi:hypothetical protein
MNWCESVPQTSEHWARIRNGIQSKKSAKRSFAHATIYC